MAAPGRRRDRAREQERTGASRHLGLGRVVAVQSLGAAASFGIIALLARLAGPDVQGEFALYKSLIDVQVALLTLGLPNGFVYVAGKGLYSPRSLARLSGRYAPVAFLLSAVLSAAYLLSRGSPLPGSTGTNIALVVLAAGATTYWALLRGVVLTVSDGIAFAWVTALPPICLLVLALVGVETGAWRLPASFAISAVLAVATVLAVLRVVGLPDGVRRSAPYAGSGSVPSSARRVLAEQSAHTLAQAVFLSGTMFTLLWLMQHLGAAVDDLGQFSVAALAVIGPNLLVGMVAPILYSRWSRSMGLAGRRRIVRRTLRVALGLQLVAVASVPAVVPGITLVLGPEYRPAAVAMCVVLLAVLPLAATRVIAPALQATGSAAVVTAAWGARLLAPVLLVPLHAVVDDVVLWAAAALVAGEHVALAVMLGLGARHTPRGSVREI